MTRIGVVGGSAALVAALTVVSMSGVVFAHGDESEELAELQAHMDEYTGDVRKLIATVADISTGYEPGGDYADALAGLIEQWESVEFHEAVEELAMPLYPPVWAAIGTFSSAIEEGAPVATVHARAKEISVALWQGYGALKLLATRVDQRGEHESAHQAEYETTERSGMAVIDTIAEKLDRVLALYKKEQSEAARELIHDTYEHYFEGIEGALIEQDPELVSGLEAAFNAALPNLIKGQAPVAEVAVRIDAMQAALERASELLAAAETQESEVF